MFDHTLLAELGENEVSLVYYPQAD
jgi:hypothetical protein